MRSRLRLAFGITLALGLASGIVVSVSPPAEAARNASGTYSLPFGPVVSGTSISSSWANGTLADLGAETTNSLDRSGRGAMAAPLQLAGGTASAPALTFSSEPASGLYRASAGDVRMQVGATQVQKWQATGVTFPLALTTQGGVTATTSTTNGAALSGTGTGTGAGASGVGGTTSGPGLLGTGGAPNGNGVTGQGVGTGPGGTFTGGPTNGYGVLGTGTGTANGGYFTGGTGGAGVFAIAGTAATGGTRTQALVAQGGDVAFTGTTVPTSTTAVSRALTPKNLVNVWAKVTTSGAGAVSVSDGFNVASVSLPGGSLVRVTFASAFASANYACVATGGSLGLIVSSVSPATTTVDFSFYDAVGAASVTPSGTAITFHFLCTGAQ